MLADPSPKGTESIPEGLHPKESLGRRPSLNTKLLVVGTRCKSIQQTIVTSQAWMALRRHERRSYVKYLLKSFPAPPPPPPPLPAIASARLGCAAAAGIDRRSIIVRVTEYSAPPGCTGLATVLLVTVNSCNAPKAGPRPPKNPSNGGPAWVRRPSQ